MSTHWHEAYRSGWCDCGDDFDALIDERTNEPVLYRCPLCRETYFPPYDEHTGQTL